MPGSEVRRGRLALPGNQGSCPISRGVDQLSQVTQARVQAPAVSTPSPRATWAQLRAVGLTTYPGRLATWSQVPRSQAALLGDSGQGPRTLVLAQLSLATWARVRGTTAPPAVPGDLGLGPRDRGVYLLPRATQAPVRGHAGSTSTPGQLARSSKCPQHQPAIPGVPGPVPKTRRVDQLCLETRARERRPLVSTRFPGRLGPGSKARGVEQFSRATRAWV